jgi:hypothetical protein
MLLMPLYKLGENNILRKLDGRTDKDGNQIDLIADVLVTGKEDLVKSFGASKNDLPYMDNILHTMGFSLDMHDESRARYDEYIEQWIEDVTQPGHIIAKQNRYIKKMGL